MQLLDRSYIYSTSQIEDVLVKVNKFIFRADFNIIDMDAEDEVPLIMGSPLLVDGRTLIDVVVEELIMRVNNEEVVFSVFKAKQYLKDANDCFLVNASCGAIAKT